MHAYLPQARTTGMDPPPGEELANDAENPCFGCGPANDVGLQLRFFDDGETVRAPVTFDERHQGWPGSVNLGLVFIALLETGTWALWERLGPAQPVGKVSFEALGQPRIGEPSLAEAQLVADGEDQALEMKMVQGEDVIARAKLSVRRATPAEAGSMIDLVPSSMRGGYQARSDEAQAEA